MPVSDPSVRDRPWLFTYNRRLRHLHGLSIRNLVLNDTSKLSRTHSVDDEALTYSYTSPSKTLAHRDQRQLEHSRSSSDLQAINEAQAAQGSANIDGQSTLPTTPSRRRPSLGRLRRRSTLEWVNASPHARQKKLENMADSRMADVFFSLHVFGSEQPVYVSEVVSKTMNPTFRLFDLHDCGPHINRQQGLIIRIWTKNEKSDEYVLLIELSLSLEKVQFVGRTLRAIRRPLPTNCILLHLTDGVYTNFQEYAISTTTDVVSGGRPSAGRPLSSSSYDALMRLSNLDACVQDALQTRMQLEQQIDEILREHRRDTETIAEVAVARESWLNAENAVAASKRRLDVAKSRRDELKAHSEARNEFIVSARRSEDEQRMKMQEDVAALPGIKTSLANLEEDLEGQRRRICEDLVKIFPIEPVPNRALYFTIRGVYLPNSDFDGERDLNEDSVAAALGWVAQIVHQLSFYLSTPLPYPITPRCSTSAISDPISTTPGPTAGTSPGSSRIYPLFMKSVPRFRFEYGVFLLNKNIEILSNRLGLRVIDLRQTLPNLKYLLYIATAGKGELPIRRAGGVRGLLRGGGVRPSSLLSRTGSVDSLASSTVGDESYKAVGAANGKKANLPIRTNHQPLALQAGFDDLRASGLVKSGIAVDSLNTRRSKELK